MLSSAIEYMHRNITSISIDVQLTWQITCIAKLYEPRDAHQWLRRREIFNSNPIQQANRMCVNKRGEVCVTQEEETKGGGERMTKFTLCISIPISEILVASQKLMSTIQFMLLGVLERGGKSFPQSIWSESVEASWTKFPSLRCSALCGTLRSFIPIRYPS